MKASPGNTPSSLSQRCHSLLAPDASSLKFLIWGRGGFHNSLITYFLVLTWTAYGLFLVSSKYLRTLYPLKQAGEHSTTEPSVWSRPGSMLRHADHPEIMSLACPGMLKHESVNQVSVYLKLGCFPKIPVRESATPSSAGNKSTWGPVRVLRCSVISNSLRPHGL